MNKIEEITYFFEEHPIFTLILIIFLIVVFFAVSFGLDFAFESGKSWSCEKFGNIMAGCKE